MKVSTTGRIRQEVYDKMIMTFNLSSHFRSDPQRDNKVRFLGKVLVRDEFEWDNNELGKVMGSFSYGYMMSQIVGGFLADKFGGAIVMAHCGVIWSLLTYLTPKLVRNRLSDFFILIFTD